MPASGYSLRATVIESLLTAKRPDVPPRVVLRNTAAVILPLGLGLATGHAEIGLGVAAGALDTMFSDQPGPYRQRMWQLFLASLAAALASVLGFLLGDQLAPMLVATAAFGFFGGLLVVFGTDIARVGMTSMILLVVTAASPTTLTGALSGAGLIFAGGLLLALFSVAAWPLQRYRPERHALAAVYRGLSSLARQQAHDDADVPALTDAMTTLQHTLLGRHHANGRAMEAFRVLLEIAERIRLELTAMAELRTNPGVHAMFRGDAARVLAAIADALEAAEPPQQAERALQTLQASENALLGRGGSGDGLAAHIHALSGQLAAAVRNANWAGSRGELRASAAETPLPAALRADSALSILRANLTPHSVAFRHAVRSAVCLSVALFVARKLALPHGYWLPMTAAIVLRPDFGATFNFGLLRVVGTVLGLVLTTAVLHFTPHDPWAHLAVMAVLCMAFRYLANAHYGIAVAALTGTVVILLSFEGVNSSAAVADRVLNTALGCGMALLAYVLWPTWERGRARAALADMLDAYAGYLQCLARPGRRDAQRESRTAARTARSNAQASLDRMRAEPATPTQLMDLASTLFANGNRLARTAMTLEAVIDDHEALPEATEIGAFVEHVAAALHTIATALRDHRAPTDLPDLRALQRSLASLLAMAEDRRAAELLERLSDRLVDNVNTLAHIVGRGEREKTAAAA
ncbi:putative membrane protein YccC [Dyella sp. SG562]|uniref:FUSC family protein n=1 Tax=Dyella TaxID=231454 RepID=UPI00141E210E|nr:MULTISPECIES: FUSC family protein [unclassified Dyella]NII75657.1 putative membrane protein YccC [Dyella sp. SG562]NKJ23428.1 putative membrane protein YccC [Dyella sp. SG609]